MPMEWGGQKRRDSRPANPTSRNPATEPPQAKVPTFDGKEDWYGFIWPFERLVRRSGWGDQQRLDRLHESLRGAVASFACALPETTQESYNCLMEELELRLGRRDHPSTA